MTGVQTCALPIWSAAITGVLCLVYGWLRWRVNAYIQRLRTHLKEDQ